MNKIIRVVYIFFKNLARDLFENKFRDKKKKKNSAETSDTSDTS